MRRNRPLFILVATLAIVLAACSADPEPTVAPTPTDVPVEAAVPTVTPDLPDAIPADSEVDRKTAIKIGIDLHRQLWDTRPSDNYKFGFQWTVGEYAYQRANVEVRIVKGEVDEVRWADNAVKTDGTEPADLVIPDMPDIGDYYNIEGLFKVISEAIDSDPMSVTLGFDSVFGFPTTVSIKFGPDSDHKDVSFFAAQLVPLPGPPQ